MSATDKKPGADVFESVAAQRDAAAYAAKPLVDIAGKAGAAAVDAAGKAGTVVAQAAGQAGAAVTDAAGEMRLAFGGTTGAKVVGTLRNADGSYKCPNPILNDKEQSEIKALTDRYDKMTKPSAIENVGKKVVDSIPEPIKGTAHAVNEQLSQQEIYRAAFEILKKGFGKLEESAAKATVSSEYVVNAVNRGPQTQKVSGLDEICLLRSYDVASSASSQDTLNLILAFSEGAATGAPGFAGIPFNLVLSTFLYYRAVQSVAMFYGYDVKNDPSELVIAGDVFASAMAPGKEGKNGALGLVGKIMITSETEAAAKAIGKGWVAAASKEGLPLFITQMRALANNAAKSALEKAGKEGLEASVFRSIFEQIGMRLSQKAVQRAVPVVGGVIGAVFDSGMMGRVLEYANVFYQKRFIVEKADRIKALQEDETVDKVMHTADVDLSGIPVSEDKGL